jgi:hypothetical protein
LAKLSGGVAVLKVHILIYVALAYLWFFITC